MAAEAFKHELCQQRFDTVFAAKCASSRVGPAETAESPDETVSTIDVSPVERCKTAVGSFTFAIEP